MRILLVDDEEELLRLLEHVLVTAGLEVVTATSLRIAHDRWTTQPFDILITDIDMDGGRTGVGLAHGLRGHQPDLGIILMSGTPWESDLPDGWIFLYKPFPVSTLLAAVEEVTRKSVCDAHAKPSGFR